MGKEAEHKAVPNHGEHFMRVDLFAPDDINVPISQELPINNLRTIYDALEHVALRRRNIQQIVEEALNNVDPSNPEAYVKPVEDRPYISFLRKGKLGFATISKNPKPDAA